MGDHEALLVLAGIAPLPLGIAVLVAHHLISGPRDVLRDDPVNLMISTVGWVLIVVGVVWPLAALLGVFSILGCVVGVFVLIEGLRKRRASQQNSLLWLLVVSAERSMPLGPAIEALARERGGAFGRKAQRLADLLAAGAPLPDALELCPRLLPVYTIPMIRIGYQSGALAPALRKAATVHNEHAPLFVSLIGKGSYLMLLPIFGFLVLLFVMTWIVPKFSMIFRDFRMDMPVMTKRLIEASYFFVNYWYLFSPLILLFAWILVYAVLRYFGWTLWDMPLLGRLARRLDSARILDGLAIVAQQQRPLGDGIAMLAESYPKSAVRRRLMLATFDVESGGDWAESLWRHSLIRQPDLAVLQAAQRAGNLPWAMQEMADSSRRRFFFKLQAMVQAAFPVVVIAFGVIVMFIVVSLFLPLIAIIQKQA